MTAVGRALIGAAVGAIATLLIHPVSRGFFLFAFDQGEPERLTSLLPARQPAMPSPDSLKSASVWAQVGAEKSESGGGLSKVERANLIAVLAAATKKEPQNAYWPQMRAAVDSSPRSPGAVEAWRRASFASGWNDHQSERLIDTRRALIQRYGVSQSWQLAYAFLGRSLAPSRLIERYARNEISRSDFYSGPGIDARFIAIQNGSLQRKGAKTLKQGEIGARIVDLAAYPPEMAGISRPKRLYLGRNVVVNSLRSFNREDAANQALKQFRENDAWVAMTQRQDADAVRGQLGAYSLLAAGVPGGFLAVLAFGLVLLGLSGVLALRKTETGYPWWGIVIVSVALGGLMGWFSSAWYIGVSVAASVAFLAVSPRHTRKATVEDLGPFFQFIAFLIAVLCAVGLIASLILGSSAAIALLPIVELPLERLTIPTIASAIPMVLAMLCLAAPAWALVHRLPTPAVLASGMNQTAKCLVAIGLFGAVVSAPVCIAVDDQLDATWAKLLSNEPVYYLQ